jgi:hypothetical protein
LSIPAALGVPTAFLYLPTQDYTLIVVGFADRPAPADAFADPTLGQYPYALELKIS